MPALVPRLSYDHLAIRNGAGAQMEWNNMVTGLYGTTKSAATAAALRTYCELDTRAMVEIAKVLIALG